MVKHKKNHAKSKAGKPKQPRKGKGTPKHHKQTAQPTSFEKADTAAPVALTLPKDVYRLFGRHPIEAALKNPLRDHVALYGTDNALNNLKGLLRDLPDLDVHQVGADQIEQMVHSDSPHQGLVLETRRLPGVHMEQACELIEGETNFVLILDQVTDPHNIGAILRSSAAFGAKAIITMDRHSPQESGVLAKSASGALDLIPWVRVGNISTAIEELQQMGYWVVGMDGYADKVLADIDAGQNVALVMGSEGKGMREGVKKKCDFVAKLPISDRVESLNVSNAAAVALYQLGLSK